MENAGEEVGMSVCEVRDRSLHREGLGTMYEESQVTVVVLY